MFRDKRVRRALGHAINTAEMTKYVIYGLGVVANGIYPPHMWYYNPDVKPLEYNPKRAKELLAEAGWRDTNGDGILEKDGKPFKFDLITNNGDPIRNDICVLAQRQLKQVGIDVNIYLYEWSVFVRDKVLPRNYEACVLGWQLSLDPDVYEIWHSSQIAKGFNFVGYSNPEADRLIEEGRTEFDREKRKAIYRRLSALIYEDQPYAFLFFPQATPALHAGAFKIKIRKPDGSYAIEGIKMTKAGLQYFMDRWFRVTNTTMQQ
jgi:peptide/nickel transport system substrate-binding protein